MKFEITIPVLNEEETLEMNVNKVLTFLETSTIQEYSVVIADNGSVDGTESIGKALMDKHREVKYLKMHKRGVGLALRSSWMQSEADVVGYMDLDLATDLKHLEEVNTMFLGGDTDIVNGSKMMKASNVYNRKLIRKITSWGFNFLAMRLLSYNITDGMCGFKFLRKKVATDLINRGITTDGWIFSTEILAKAHWSNYKIKEIAVDWTDDQTSKVKIVKLSYQFFCELLRIRTSRKEWIVNNN